MQYVNEGIPFMVNSLITEYDIRHGNTSIMRHFKLRPPDVIDRLDSLPKGERNRQVGLMVRDDHEFGRRLEKGFNDAVEQFLSQNGLDIDVDIQAIRRDAVFVVNRPVRKPTIGDAIEFIPKNRYNALLKLKQLEFYFDHDRLDIKNFVSAEADINHAIEKLQAGPIAFVREFIDVCESSNMNRHRVYTWIREFAEYYKKKQLDFEYYREFTRDALFRVNIDGEPMYLDIVTDDVADDIDISFNYLNLFIPLLQVVI